MNSAGIAAAETPVDQDAILIGAVADTVPAVTGNQILGGAGADASRRSHWRYLISFV